MGGSVDESVGLVRGVGSGLGVGGDPLVERE